MDLIGQENQEVENQEVDDDSLSQDGDLRGCGQLESRWILWHEFMKEHAQLDAWLLLAERAVSPTNPAHISYITARQELRRFERLRSEAGSQLVCLDSLTQRNRTLSGMFEGSIRDRLLATARDCSRRWDQVNAQLESTTGRLKVRGLGIRVEEFEAERAELTLWLSDLDVRLSAVDQLTGNTCDKLRRLQSFQQCVCENSLRVNALLQRGETLIQHSESSDAQRVECHLLELLRHCSLVYNNIARTHTRLLSMRLVFEDDCLLSPAPDSGCPSESLLEEEGTLDKSHLDLHVHSSHLKDSTHPAVSSAPPSHDHLGLEWDPSVDIGRSISHHDNDSSYFSTSTGLYRRDGLKRRSYLSSLGSLSDISYEAEAELPLDGWLERGRPSVLPPIAVIRGGDQADLNGLDQWASSTPDGQACEPISFDGQRVRAWLGGQRPAPLPMTTSCSRYVQTDTEVKCCFDGSKHRHDVTQPFLGPAPSPSHDLIASSDWLRKNIQSELKPADTSSCCEESERFLSEKRSSKAFLYFLLLAAALALLAGLIWVAMETPCHRSNRMPRGFHLTLRYVNGPPPT